MTQSELMDALTHWETVMRQARDHELTVLDPLDLYPESPLHQIVWTLAGEVTRLTAALVGDDAEWLSWYATENDLGARGLEAGALGQLKPIKTLDDLAGLICTFGGGDT